MSGLGEIEEDDDQVLELDEIIWGLSVAHGLTVAKGRVFMASWKAKKTAQTAA